MKLKQYHALIAVWLIVFNVANSVLAGSVTTTKLGNRESLRVTYTPDPDGAIPGGEILITVVPTSGQPSSADRELDVFLYTASYGADSTVFTTKVFLAEGATSATARLPYTQPLNYGAWVFDVSEEGQNIVKPRIPMQSTNTQNRKSILEITSGSNNTKRFLVDASGNDVKTSTVQIYNSPADWRGYVGYEVVIIGAESFELASKEQLKALSDYVLAGGYLVVHNATSETALSVDRQFLNKPDLQLRDDRWDVYKSVDRQYGSTRRHGGGYIVVYETVSPNWYELVRRSEQYPFGDLVTKSAADRSWFWRNLVMSVGKTPIWSFVAFVTLFVIAVGPIMFRVTDKLRHRTLLLFLVPTFSFAATLLFMLFNVSRDGFGTYGRVAALHYYDVNTNQGFSWSRQSYFSGGPPREGLRFDASTFIRPYDGEYENTGWNDPRDRVGAVISLGQNDLYLSGWMTPRSQQSLLAGTPVGASQFPISAKTISDDKISIKNETTELIPVVVLKQSSAICFYGLDLAPGETRELTAEPASRVDAALRGLQMKLEPKAPVEVDTLPMQSYSRYYYRSAESLVDPIDNALRKYSTDALQENGYWIVCQQLPKHSLPFSSEIYSKEKHFLIMTGAYKW